MSEGELEPFETVGKHPVNGRFLPGNHYGGGRPTQRTLTMALRDVADPDAMARRLVRRAAKSDQVLMYIFNRLEGMPRQAVEFEDKTEPPAITLLRALAAAMETRLQEQEHRRLLDEAEPER